LKSLTARSLELLWIIAVTDFKLRYSNSVLGYLWSLLKPLLMFLVLYTVFTVLVQLDIAHYQLRLLLGIVLWNFFAESTSMGMSALLAKATLITKVKFSRWIVVVASTLSSVMTLMLNLVIFAGFLFFSGVSLKPSAVLFVLYVVELYLLVLGISLGLSVLLVKYRDIFQIWEVLLQAGFFMTPIVYSLDIVPPKYHLYMLVNPLTPIVEDSRRVLVDGAWPTVGGNVAAAAAVLLILGAGSTVFRTFEPRIAEEM
jgi:lipopolysaccharide transport system permease protein